MKKAPPTTEAVETITCVCAGGPLSGYRYDRPSPQRGWMTEFFYHLKQTGQTHVYAARYGGGRILTMRYMGIVTGRKDMIRQLATDPAEN